MIFLQPIRFWSARWWAKPVLGTENIMGKLDSLFLITLSQVPLHIIKQTLVFQP